MKHHLIGSAMALVAATAAWTVSSYVAAGHGAARAQVVQPLAPPPPKLTNYGGCPMENQEFHACAVEKEKAFEPPRTPDGTPDFQGYWRGRGTNSNRSVERVTPDNPMTRDPIEPWQTSEGMLIDPPDRMLPYQPWAAKIGRMGENYHHYIDPRTSCGTAGVPRSLTDRTLILQAPGARSITFLFEDQMGSRIVPTDGRPHIGRDLKLTNGDAVGHWEGKTLVIEVTNLNGYTWLDDSANTYSNEAKVTERLTMIDKDTIHATATIEDPKAYTAPWTMVWPMLRDATPGGYEFLEEACREGERWVARLRKTGVRYYRGNDLPISRPR